MKAYSIEEILDAAEACKKSGDTYVLEVFLLETEPLTMDEIVEKMATFECSDEDILAMVEIIDGHWTVH